MVKIVKELDAEFDELAKSEGINPHQQITKYQDVNIIHKCIDLMQQTIRDNREKTHKQLRDVESRIIDGMSSFFINANNSNALDNKRPKNITFRNQLDINQSANTNNTSSKQIPN